MLSKWQYWATWVANILLPLAVLVFSSGFFPYKPLLPGLATFEHYGDDPVPPAIFDKIIFMVVDALRSDFIFSNSSHFLFTQSLIRSGAAFPFTAYAGSPTVTMPRLKAMTTGCVPSFLDVIINIAESDTSSTLASQDTWLAQLKARGNQLVMYGDDTWLKLFPGLFERTDGTTSFFVSDFVEVDNNVTRHIPAELSNIDWSAMIMHYLGLDHIGHKTGPNSPFMKSKQREMDAIVNQIYTAMEEREHLNSTLFVLCGDHGMTDAGNHGGSTPGETSPALLFISPRFKTKNIHYQSPVKATNEFQFYRTVEQSDITPTIAGLLGIPISLNSLGVFIPELLTMWPHGYERASLLMSNARQLLRTVETTFPTFSLSPAEFEPDCDPDKLSGIKEVQCAWSHVPHSISEVDRASEVESILLRFSRAAQRLLSSTASNYDVPSLYSGILIAAVAALLSVLVAHEALLLSGFSGAFLTLNMLGYTGMMFASSYVEEEQHFWYWTLTGWLVFLHVKYYTAPRRLNCKSNTVQSRGSCFRYLTGAGTFGLAILLRLMRRWNQTGQKFAGEPDIASNFLPCHQNLLWALIILTYTESCKSMMLSLPCLIFPKILAIAVVGAAFAFKLAFVASDSPELLQGSFLFGWLTGSLHSISLITSARAVFCGLALIAFYSFVARREEFERVFHETLTMFLITQTKATNIPLFLLMKFQFIIVSSMNLTNVEVTVWSVLSQYMTFFAFGGSNALSSIDLSSAYNGIGRYNVMLVGLLTFLSNWAGPVWWVSACCQLRPHRKKEERQSEFAVLTFHAAMALLSVMAACTALRTHLFIWTVFSPKFLYSMAWALGNHMCINVLGPTSLHVLREYQKS